MFRVSQILLGARLRFLTLCLALTAGALGFEARAVDYAHDVVPILNRYCAGCHNSQDREGGFSVQSHAELLVAGDSGPVLVVGDSTASRLIQVLAADADPSMPPEGEPRPGEEQISVLRRWIDEGAVGPIDSNGRRQLSTPHLNPSPTPKPITAMASSSDGERLAVGRFKSVDLVTRELQFVQRFGDHPGKVNAIAFHPHGTKLLVATGITGLFGETWIWDLRRGEVILKLGGHDDSVYALACSPDGRWLATAGYDRKIQIWELPQGSLQRTLVGHNGPVFDLAFAPDNRILASASADATVKIWDAVTGERMDTLSQPLKDQYSVDISPDGQFVVAGGADNRLRLWRLLSTEQPQINPMLVARYAHEQPIHRVRFSRDGLRLVSVSADKTAKVWDARDLTSRHVHSLGGEMAETCVWPAGTDRLFVGRMDGAIEQFELKPWRPDQRHTLPTSGNDALMRELSPVDELATVDEMESNDDVHQAQHVSVPVRIRGKIHLPDSRRADADVFRFSAQAGQMWMIEVQAARDGSPLDSVVRVLDAEGRPVPRVILRAVRDSYFTFRGKDSTQTGDFRLQNWEEMTLNQFLFANGEVVKLYHYPRGPDSGFNVYPNFGSRYGFFETTPVTHALQEPCYIVEPYAPGTVLPANGLPEFTLYFENDDESQRRWGSDSLLTFKAPSDGEYYVVLQDVRQFQGDEYHYQLSIRPPRPDFRAKLLSDSLKIPQGSGQKFGVQLERLDGFDGEVAIDVEGLPKGLEVTQPLVVQSGQARAWGTVFTRDDRTAPWVEESTTAKVFATAIINGQTVRKLVGEWGPIKLRAPAKVSIDFIGNAPGEGEIPSVIEIQAGATATAQIRIARYEGESGPVSFGSEEAVVNAPHGVYVDNIGLNGVLITESETERSVLLQAEPWLEPVERLVFVEATVDGTPTSRPILLRVTRATQAVASDTRPSRNASSSE